MSWRYYTRITESWQTAIAVGLINDTDAQKSDNLDFVSAARILCTHLCVLTMHMKASLVDAQPNVNYCPYIPRVLDAYKTVEVQVNKSTGMRKHKKVGRTIFIVGQEAVDSFRSSCHAFPQRKVRQGLGNS